MRKGDEVYVKATITLAPEGDRTLYRVVTPEGAVIWVKEYELVKKEET